MSAETPVETPATPSVPETATLPSPADAEIVALIPGYDDLNATEVIEMTKGLTAEERGAVRKYEAAHMKRVTVLNALAKG